MGIPVGVVAPVDAGRGDDAPIAAGSDDVKVLLRERDADMHLARATEKLRGRDGAACLAELDQHDALDKRPEHLSVRPDSSVALIRAECLMLAGRCDAGKSLMRRAYPAQVPRLGPEQLETMVDANGVDYCTGALTPREELLKASSELQRGSMNRVDAAVCAKSYETVKRLAASVPPRSADDGLLKAATSPLAQGYTAAGCFARAGDCASARRAYDDGMNAIYQGKSPMTAAQSADAFERAVPACKPK